MKNIEVTRKFRISAHIARTIYGNTKEELIRKVVNREVLGDYYSLQEYKNGKWITIGEFKSQ